MAASSEGVMNDLVAQDHSNEQGDPALHPLAAEEWLGSQILAALGDPRTVCQVALVNKNFSSASRSDLVWLKLLPPPLHLESLLKECDDKSLQNSTSFSKQEIYFHLCRSISLNGGLKKFWLDQRTGGECYMLSARALAIVWGSSPEYWKWLPCHGAWFREVAFLRSVCWFDISGKFRQLLKPGSYVVSFRMQMRSASIWRWSPIKLSLQNLTYAQPPVKSRAFFHRPLPISDPPLTSPPIPDAGQPSADNSLHSESDHHVWVECDVGKFTVEKNEDIPVEVEFSMREVEVLGWKSGFLLDGVLIRPSYVVDARDRPTISMGSIYGYKDGDDEEMSVVENGFIDENEERDWEDNYADDSSDEDENVDDANDNAECLNDGDDGGDGGDDDDHEDGSSDVRNYSNTVQIMDTWITEHGKEV